MLDFSSASLTKLSIHQVGNKSKGDLLHLSDKPFPLRDNLLLQILTGYFTFPFIKEAPVFEFTNSNGDLHLNPVYQYARQIFDEPMNLHKYGSAICRHLYEIADHPNIKSGEVYVVYFQGVDYAGEVGDAIGIFKSETKDTFIKVLPEEKNFRVIYEQDAINVKKIDKGCFILNIDKKNGFTVFTADQTNNTDTIYWVDKFLNLKYKNNSFAQTKSLLDVYRTFVKQELENEMELANTDKIDLLNRSISFMKARDHFDIDEFAYEVIGNPEAIDKFKKFKQEYESEFDLNIDDDFLISDAAVKKQSRFFKSVLKLDKNFHVYIHGNTDLIEKGFDKSKGKNYYKIYFDEEA